MVNIKTNHQAKSITFSKPSESMILEELKITISYSLYKQINMRGTFYTKKGTAKLAMPCESKKIEFSSINKFLCKDYKRNSNQYFQSF